MHAMLGTNATNIGLLPGKGISVKKYAIHNNYQHQPPDFLVVPLYSLEMFAIFNHRNSCDCVSI